MKTLKDLVAKGIILIETETGPLTNPPKMFTEEVLRAAAIEHVKALEKMGEFKIIKIYLEGMFDTTEIKDDHAYWCKAKVGTYIEFFNLTEEDLK